MSEQILRISASTQIARTIDVVRRHFSDVRHHAINHVHAGVDFTPLADSNDDQRFRKTIRILGVPVVDEVVLRRQPDGSITEDTVAGPSVGMRFTNRFESVGPARTAVTSTVELPVSGAKRLVTPLLRRMILQRLTKALEEDRQDLESGRYPS